jgi:hypothetical protein
MPLTRILLPHLMLPRPLLLLLLLLLPLGCSLLMALRCLRVRAR